MATGECSICGKSYHILETTGMIGNHVCPYCPDTKLKCAGSGKAPSSLVKKVKIGKTPRVYSQYHNDKTWQAPRRTK